MIVVGEFVLSMSNRVCQQCGTPLAPGQEFCSNCGSHYASSGAYDPTQRATSYPGAQPPPVAPTQYAGPSSPYSSPAYGDSPYGSPNTSYGSQEQSYAPPPPPLPAVPYAGAYGQPQQFGGGFPQAPQPQKKGPNVGLIIGIIALLVVLVGGGVFLLGRSGGGSTNNPSNPTSVVSGTAPVVTSAPTPQALFSDNFANNNNGWATGSATGLSRSISNNALVMTENNHKILVESLPTTTVFDDFMVTVNFTLTQSDQNDGAGVYVRGDSNLDHDYRIEVFGDNTYFIGKEYLDSNKTGKVTSIVAPTKADALHPVGQENKMTVVMKGPTLVLLLNDTVVKTITDSDYTRGQIALFAENGTTSSGVKASFSTVAVYHAPSQLPS